MELGDLGKSGVRCVIFLYIFPYMFGAVYREKSDGLYPGGLCVWQWVDFGCPFFFLVILSRRI